MLVRSCRVARGHLEFTTKLQEAKLMPFSRASREMPRAIGIHSFGGSKNNQNAPNSLKTRQRGIDIEVQSQYSLDRGELEEVRPEIAIQPDSELGRGAFRVPFPRIIRSSRPEPSFLPSGSIARIEFSRESPSGKPPNRQSQPSARSPCSPAACSQVSTFGRKRAAA